MHPDGECAHENSENTLLVKDSDDVPPLDPPLSRCDNGGMNPDYAWLAVFCITGVGLGMSFEYLDLQSTDGHSPAAASSFFLCFIGYWSQTIVGGGYVLSLWASYRRSTTSPNSQLSSTLLTSPSSSSSSSSNAIANPLRGTWSYPVLRALLLSALFDGVAQALDYIGQVNGGYIIFTIFHSSVTIFSCAIAVLMLRASVSVQQWLGVGLIVAGILVTALPSPIHVTGNFFLGIVCSCAGSLCLAASYPFSELVFRLGEGPDGDTVARSDSENVQVETARSGGCVGEEMSCFVGSLLNTVVFTLWTLVYTVPRWDVAIAEYIKPGRGANMAFGLFLYGVMVGMHSLSFWKSVHRMGTVPCAVAKGAQQAGIFVFSHLIYCRVDASECINSGDTLWERMQKSVAFVLCCAGVVMYALDRRDGGDDDHDDSDKEE